MMRVRLCMAAALLVVLASSPPVLAEDRDPAQLARDLVAEDHEVRSAARSAIDELGPRAVPALIAALETASDPDPYLARLVQWNLAPYAGSHAATLVRLLERGPARAEVILILSRMGADGVSAHPLLERVLRDPKADRRTQAAAAIALLRGGHPAGVVVGALPALEGGALVDTADIAEALLMAAREHPEAAERLAATSFVPDAGASAYVFAAVADLGSLGRPAAATLLRRLASPQPDVRLSAAATLLRVGAARDQALAALEQAMGATDMETLRALGNALRLAIAPDTITCLTPLLERAPRTHWITRKAWWALARLGPAAEPAAAAMTRWLTEGECVEDGLLALVHLGPRAGVARSSLDHLLEHATDPWMLALTALCVLRLDPADADALAVLESAVPAVDDADRLRLARAMGCAGPEFPGVAPYLAQMLGHERHDIRAMAAIALAQAGAAATAFRTDLIAALADSYPNVRLHAAYTLHTTHPEGLANPADVAACAAHLANEHWAVRTWMAALLTRGPHKHPLDPAMLPALRYAAGVRPTWRPSMDTQFTWEPYLEVRLADTSRDLLGKR